MDRGLFQIDRRAVFKGLSATLVMPSLPAFAQNRTTLALEAVAGTLSLKGQPPTPIGQLVGGPNSGPLRFRRGETVDLTLTNRLDLPVALQWTGLDGVPLAEPFTRPLLSPNATSSYPVTFRHAGTMTADIRLPGGSSVLPSTVRPVIVSEMEPVEIDRDEVLAFQDWRLKPDGSAVPPGSAETIFTVNGALTSDITADQNQRLRLRLINSCQNTVIAIKIIDYDVRIMAIDGQPSEPFPARDGLVVLSPGSRVDVFVDADRPPGSTSAIMLLDGREARPIGKIMTSNAKPLRGAPLPTAGALPSNGLPAQLDLKSALRVDLPLGTSDWQRPATMTPAASPAFRVKRGRTIVLALANRGISPAVFRLHGHHFRLLDRLDDGWKPFWLDTLAIDAGQTQRIAFAAEFEGLYPMQVRTTDRAAPPFFRSYLVG